MGLLERKERTMEKVTVIENKDGSTVTIREKNGFVVRDGIISIVGGIAGIAMGGVAVPMIEGILPEVIKASKAASKVAVGLGAFTVGEITEHSVKRALTDVSEFTDDIYYEMATRKAAKIQAQTETVTEEQKTVPNQGTNNRKK